MMVLDDKIAIEGGVSQVLQLIPDEWQAALIQIGESWSRDRWAIGDFTNRIKERIRSGEVNAAVMHVYQAVAALLKQEVSARTVEYYAAISDFYPADVRDKYYGLPHSHFSFAMRFGERWPEVLGTSLDYFDKHGRFPAVAYLEDQFTISPPHDEPDDGYQESGGEDESSGNGLSVLNTQFAAAIASMRALGTALEQRGLTEEAERIEGMITELQSMY